MKRLTLYHAVFILLAMHITLFFSCAEKSDDSNVMTNVSKAANPSVDVRERIRVATLLSEKDRDRLRSELSAALPGGWDKPALDAIEILGEIGNEETMEVLEKVNNLPNDASGKFHPAIRDSIAKIQKRLSTQK